MYSLVLMAALSTGGETPNFFFHKWGCHGCNGCWSGCHGCWGGWGGCNGCWGGGCHGWGWRHRWACHGCWGGCNGCYSAGYGCYSACHGCYAAPVMMPMQPATPPKAEPVPPPKGSGQLSTPAKLVVELPENAKLYVDEHLMKTTSGVRSFNTPALQQGQTYFYMLRAEVVRDGRTFEETKRVLVRAGETVRANFVDLERSLTTASATAPVTDGDDDQEP